MMKFIRHSGSTIQYNTMQSNVKNANREKTSYAYKSTKLVYDSSVVKISKKPFLYRIEYTVR